MLLSNHRLLKGVFVGNFLRVFFCISFLFGSIFNSEASKKGFLFWGKVFAVSAVATGTVLGVKAFCRSMFYTKKVESSAKEIKSLKKSSFNVMNTQLSSDFQLINEEGGFTNLVQRVTNLEKKNKEQEEKICCFNEKIKKLCSATCELILANKEYEDLNHVVDDNEDKVSILYDCFLKKESNEDRLKKLESKVSGLKKKMKKIVKIKKKRNKKKKNDKKKKKDEFPFDEVESWLQTNPPREVEKGANEVIKKNGCL